MPTYTQQANIALDPSQHTNSKLLKRLNAFEPTENKTLSVDAQSFIAALSKTSTSERAVIIFLISNIKLGRYDANVMTDLHELGYIDLTKPMLYITFCTGFRKKDEDSPHSIDYTHSHKISTLSFLLFTDTDLFYQLVRPNTNISQEIESIKHHVKTFLAYRDPYEPNGGRLTYNTHFANNIFLSAYGNPRTTSDPLLYNRSSQQPDEVCKTIDDKIKQSQTNRNDIARSIHPDHAILQQAYMYQSMTTESLLTMVKLIPTTDKQFSDTAQIMLVELIKRSQRGKKSARIWDATQRILLEHIELNHLNTPALADLIFMHLDLNHPLFQLAYATAIETVTTRHGKQSQYKSNKWASVKVPTAVYLALAKPECLAVIDYNYVKKLLETFMRSSAISPDSMPYFSTPAARALAYIHGSNQANVKLTIADATPADALFEKQFTLSSIEVPTAGAPTNSPTLLNLFNHSLTKARGVNRIQGFKRGLFGSTLPTDRLAPSAPPPATEPNTPADPPPPYEEASGYPLKFSL